MQTNLLSQRSLAYLFVCVGSALLLHSEFLPVWVLLLAPTIIVWRFAIFRGRAKIPNAFIKFCLVSSGFYGVYFSYGLSLSIEAAVTLLVAGLVLKPLEVQTKRDSYVLVFLCYFVLSQHFLFDQGPLAFLFVLVCLFITLLTQVVINQSEESKSHSKVAGKIFLFSVPLTIFLFFILPRLGPLWSLNVSTKSGVVGLSSTMSPGDVSELGKSDELAFRVRFDGEVPAVSERYWRALILDYYSGETWESRYSPDTNWHGMLNPLDSELNDLFQGYRYEIISEAHEKKWLFALAGSKPLQAAIGISDDGLLVNKYKALNTFQYKVQAPLAEQLTHKQGGRLTLTALEKQAYLQLPRGLNPKARGLANTVYSKSRSDETFIHNLSRYYLSNPFSYTLSPGELDSDDRVDEFLFGTKSGFCAHYAGSLVFLLRSAGVPSRVVLGYLGGEKNEIGDYFSVYQYDAHAWVEVWLKGKGWLRVDPTGWVSPERVEQGIEQAVKNEFTGFKTQSQWIREFRHQLQALNYYWNDWMLSYKGDRQKQILDAVFGKRDSLSLFFIISGLFVALLILVFVLVMAGNLTKRDSQQRRFFLYYIHSLKKMRVDVNDAMSFEAIEAEILKQYPSAIVPAKKVSEQLNDIFFASTDVKFDRLKRKHCRKLVKLLIKSLRKQGLS